MMERTNGIQWISSRNLNLLQSHVCSHSWIKVLCKSFLITHTLFTYPLLPHSVWSCLSGDSVQFSRSVVSDSLRPMNCNTPGLPVHHQLPEFTRLTSIESVMPSSHLILCHPLLLLPPMPPSIRVFSNESPLRMRWPKYWISALASFLPKNTQGWSPSEWTGWISFQSKGLSRVFSNTTVQKHQFFGAQLSSQSNSHIHTWPLEKP